MSVTLPYKQLIVTLRSGRELRTSFSVEGIDKFGTLEEALEVGYSGIRDLLGASPNVGGHMTVDTDGGKVFVPLREIESVTFSTKKRRWFSRAY